MYSVINSQSDLTELITLAEVKRQCNIIISDTEDDLMLSDLIGVATELAQKYCNRLLTVGSVTIELLSYTEVINLPYGNVTSIDSVVIDGTESDNWTFYSVSQKLKVHQSYKEIAITYTCGMTSIPPPVKHGILMLISTLFNFRDDLITGFNVSDIPLSSARLLDAARLYHV